MVDSIDVAAESAHRGMLAPSGVDTMIREGDLLDGKYHMLQPVGSGGMGAVWLAEKIATLERFAIKFIIEQAVGDDSYCARFTREVAVLRGLRHPHIVDVYDWSLPERGSGEAGYVVMEYLDGETLQQVLRREGRLPVPTVSRIMLQVLDGVAAVHAMGIVHRDLSPSNIFLVAGPSTAPRVKILDFGLAKGTTGGTADGAVTQPGSVLGRAAYAAPEIFLERELDARADIFACGMIMYRALAGRFPYKETKVDLVWAERYADRTRPDIPHPPPSRFERGIPEQIEQVVMRAIRKRPGERYATAEEMQKHLLAADARLPAPLRAAGAGPRHISAPASRPEPVAAAVDDTLVSDPAAFAPPTATDAAGCGVPEPTGAEA
ncbi:MAG: serine/threonine-protein kinase, partial [Myxococcota bacterium]|nr:serine/threonine-protein kinase [Myxococcota bacterium]